MKHWFILAAAALAVAGCGDAGNPVSARGSEPALATGPSGPVYTLFTTQTPASFLSASPGWEVGTRFKATVPGRIIGFRFYRAPGESGTNRARLWSNGGTLLRTATLPNSGRSGWDTVYLSSNQPRIAANTSYRVSVNTNAQQAKTSNAGSFLLINGSLQADLSYYGQPTGSMPTQSSNSFFFADVIFVPDGAVPNLYVSSITYNAAGPSVSVVVCNNGTAAAGASTTRVEHWFGVQYEIFNLATPSISVNACTTVTTAVIEPGPGTGNDYYVDVDDLDVLYEADEGDNHAVAEGLS
ncbi:DUF4082 domain-containing protein [Longimicrobium sp.]|uniref:DUF4082 domain-containing protein n=1 Tax=Longimicrobium sp. TaxID=2029185 RepID=UPI002E34A38E|nr:DUF4082 domain-containing protein [Longimicrobium sp.]HEX6042160.1 DUF4082 domain-containing protein [Longimicrobium sp.]